MNRGTSSIPVKPLIATLLLLSVAGLVTGQELGTPLVLQEMTWTDVRDYLKTSDMVIIPLGSTEQHGPHMPLGTDYYEAIGMAKRISARTGVVVAPVLLAGYSLYHSGFPGTLSLKPETMERVLFETAEMLMKYGFRRFMFFNYHGGNRVVESKVIHRINQETESTALAIGIGAPFQKGGEHIPGVEYDEHAGIHETSLMLYLQPELVKMERAAKPELHFSLQMQEILELSRKYPTLTMILGTLQAVPAETKKGGASHDISSNGIWSLRRSSIWRPSVSSSARSSMTETGRNLSGMKSEEEKFHYDLLQAQYDSVTHSGFWLGSAEFQMDGKW